MPRGSRLPSRIDVLDLFCGDGSKIIAKADPQKVFVGVDKRRLPKKNFPPNVHLVRQDVLHFLRTRRYGERVGEVHMDYGLHFLPEHKRSELYNHVRSLLSPHGTVHVTAYDRHRVANTERIAAEFQRAGFKVHDRTPVSELSSEFESLYTRRAIRLNSQSRQSTRLVLSRK